MSEPAPPLRLTRRGRVVLLVLAVALAFLLVRLLTGWGDGGGAQLGTVLGDGDAPTASEAPMLRVSASWAVPEDGFLLDDDGPAGLTLVESAPVVVSADDPGRVEAVWLAARLGVPLVVPEVLDGESTLALPASWDTRVVVDVGGAEPAVDEDLVVIPLPVRSDVVGPSPPVGSTTPSPTASSTTAAPGAPPTATTPATDPTSEAPPPGTARTLADVREAVAVQPDLDLDPVAELLDAVPEDDGERPFTALVRPEAGPATLVPLVLAGAAIEQTSAVDLFAEDGDLVAGLAGPVVQAGTSEQWEGVDPETWNWQREVVTAGVELPGGGYRVFPEGRRYVALYGSPETTALGVLGEQDVGASIERARSLASDYEGLDGLQPVPAWDLIATVASGSPEPTEDYSRRVPLEVIREWVDAAGDGGVYVLLDLQSGRSDFLSQAMELEEVLREPHVGLALDPEWRLEPDELHLVQIGSVTIEEVNETAAWLAELTREAGLPEKLFLVHQFTRSMIEGKERFVDLPQLAESVQMDGQGSQPGKLSTWESIVKVDVPDHVVLGWKNFYDEDPETRSPADTVALDPTPRFISYQ